jgi:tRNA-dependent cyclodipeptide synthase
MSIPGNFITNANHETIEIIDSLMIYEHSGKNDKKYQLTLNLVGTTPAHLKGWELVKKRDLMMVGVSVGNGYFSKHRLEILLTGMAHYFTELVVVIADLPALHSYRAMGYDERTALRKLKDHGYPIINHCKAIFKRISQKHPQVKTQIITWRQGFSQENYYRDAYQRAITLYQHHAEFRKTVQRHTEHYLLARLEGQDLQQMGGMKTAIEIAAHYLLEEMAFHEIFHLILDKEPLISYYKELELAPHYLNGDYGNPPNKSGGWVVYNIYEKT